MEVIKALDKGYDWYWFVTPFRVLHPQHDRQYDGWCDKARRIVSVKVSPEKVRVDGVVLHEALHTFNLIGDDA